MKLGVISDIHTELGLPRHDILPQERVDVMVLAGDIGKGVQALQFAHETYRNSCDHIVIIAGNHEFYRGTYQSVLRSMREHADSLPGLHFLEDNTVTLDGVNFIGATAWTDYSYGGAGQPLNMYRAADLLNDYKKIKWNQGGVYRKLLARDLLHINHASKRYVFDELRRLEGETNVVVTHHAPTAASIHSKFERDEANFCYANTWGNDIAYSSARLWIHGHMHDASDYQVGDCRVVCNPCDYPDSQRGVRPLIIEV